MEQYDCLVSIVIPFYNRVEYLLESITSATSQTYVNWELLLINDGSTENISDVLDLIKGNEKIRLFSQENAGVSAARNFGIAHASGKYIAFLDSDDIWMKNKLEVQVSYMEKHNCYFSHTSYQRMKSDHSPLEVIHSGLQCDQIYPSLMSNCSIAAPTVMLRREVLCDMQRPFPTEFHIGEDICLWITLASKYNCGGIDRPLAFVRVGESTATLSPAKQAVGLRNILTYINQNSKFRIEFAHTDRLWEMICDAEAEATAKVPMVSIIIPVYNGADYMRNAIDSALAQTYSNIEVLVIDDGSNDDGATERIALSYGSQIRYFSKENGGVASALNLGISKMMGEYFSWLSHDDMYKPKKIEHEMEILKASGRMDTIIAGGYDVVDSSAKYMYSVTLTKQYTSAQLSIPLFALLHGGINGCALLLHRSHFDRVGMFDESLPSTQDYELWFRMFRRWPICYYPGEYVQSRWHENQGSKKMDGHIAACNDLWIWMITNTSHSERCQLAGNEINFYADIAKFLEESTPYKDALIFVRHALNASQNEVVANASAVDIPTAANKMTVDTLYTVQIDDGGIWHKECLLMQQSLSWRLTKPLRSFKKFIVSLRGGHAPSDPYPMREDLYMAEVLKMQSSLSWRISKPLRLLKKVIHSMKVNGFAITIKKIRQKL